MTTTADAPAPVTTETTLPAAAEPRLTIPLSAILEFERESAALGDALDAVADEEDRAAREGCLDCQVEEVLEMALDANSNLADAMRTEALLITAGSMSPDCTCDRSPDAACSETCVDPACVAAVMHARYGG